MTTAQPFTGLGMPVFAAFGWAGQDAAVNFALDQLESFIRTLHARLPRSVQAEFPYAGLSRANQTVYLAAKDDVESDMHVLFHARPMSLELQLALTDKRGLYKALALAEKQPAMAHRLITELGSEWSFRLQQQQIDEESGERTHYQDLYKDGVVNLDEETAVALLSKAAYLTGEEKWVTPLYVSRRFSSDQISVMGVVVIDVVTKELERLLPLIHFLNGQKATKSAKPKPKVRPKLKTPAESTAVATTTIIDPDQGFMFVTDIKPLYLRKGFINMAPDHWPFFAVSARSETRNVTVYYEGVYDKDCSVWRIQSSDMVRLVLSPGVHRWFEDNFEQGDHVQLNVKRLDNDEIQISVKHSE
ncbi:MAG: hypothetical protein KF770_28280 [Anaerolineae bacterium]|nr:hypothetical protein [Anaerolineae bacterium]